MCEVCDSRLMLETRCVRFVTPGVLLETRCEVCDSRCDVGDSCEVCEARFYACDSFCEIFDCKYDVETFAGFLTQGIMFVMRFEICDPRFNVWDSFEFYGAKCYICDSFCEDFDPRFEVYDLRHGLLHSSCRQDIQPPLTPPS